jgi:O-antigen ligase
MIEALIVAACYAAFWSNVGGLTEPLRAGIFACLFSAAALAVARGKLRPVPPSPFEALLYVVGLLSAAVSLVRGADYSITYTVYFLAITVFLSVIVREVSLERLLDTGAVTILLCVATCLIVEHANLITVLEISIGRNGMERFHPLNNHPLMTGYIFGSGSFLLARRAYLATRRGERLTMIAGVALCWIFVLAASARSSLLGLMASLIFATFFEIRIVRFLSLKSFALLLVVIGVGTAVYLGSAGNYLSQILQLDSSYRGVGTGATGRTELWMEAIDTFLSDPTLILFGGGLRSSEYSVIGFLTENSYLTFLLDSGLFVGGAMIMLLVYSPFRALRISSLETQGSTRARLRFLPSFLLFPLVQCFYIRSYIGISNPASLLMLIMVMSLSVRLAFQAAGQPAPKLAPRHRSASRRLAAGRAPGVADELPAGDLPTRTPR